MERVRATAPGEVTVSQVDLNGSALKLRQVRGRHRASTQARQTRHAQRPRRRAAQTEPGTPSLRSGGLSRCAMRRPAPHLENRFERSGAIRATRTERARRCCCAEDLVAATTQRCSIMRRRGVRSAAATPATASSPTRPGSMTRTTRGWSGWPRRRRLTARTPTCSSSTRALFTWSGWSLAAPPIGRRDAGGLRGRLDRRSPGGAPARRRPPRAAAFATVSYASGTGTASGCGSGSGGQSTRLRPGARAPGDADDRAGRVPTLRAGSGADARARQRRDDGGLPGPGEDLATSRSAR